MKVLITGSSGLIGSALIEFLKNSGHEVVRLLRTRQADDSPFWDPEHGVIKLAGSGNVDAVVHLAGENLAEGRWNERKKERILSSRVKGTTLVADFFAAAQNKPDVIISASGVGIYGNRGAEINDENSALGTGFLADVAKKWEWATAKAQDAGIRVVNVRFGSVLSGEGGILKRMLPLFRLGLGGVIGSGEQYLSWVSIKDVVEIIQFVMGNESIDGPVNLVSPNPVTNREFTDILGRALNRSTLFKLPAFAARLAFGEMADEVLLASTRVVPKKLLERGYMFHHPDLAGALEYLLNNPSNT